MGYNLSDLLVEQQFVPHPPSASRRRQVAPEPKPDRGRQVVPVHPGLHHQQDAIERRAIRCVRPAGVILFLHISQRTIPAARRGTLNGPTRPARSGALRHCMGSNTLMLNTAAHGRRVGAGWKNTPAVIVPEKEDREHARRMRSLDAHVASVIRIQATEPCDVRWRSRGRSEPFVNQ
jgi:hypothetical protein